MGAAPVQVGRHFSHYFLGFCRIFKTSTRFLREASLHHSMPGTLLITLTLTSLVAVPLHFVWMRSLFEEKLGVQKNPAGTVQKKLPKWWWLMVAIIFAVKKTLLSFGCAPLEGENIYPNLLRFRKEFPFRKVITCWYPFIQFLWYMIQGGLLPVMSRVIHSTYRAPENPIYKSPIHRSIPSRGSPGEFPKVWLVGEGLGILTLTKKVWPWTPKGSDILPSTSTKLIQTHFWIHLFTKPHDHTNQSPSPGNVCFCRLSFVSFVQETLWSFPCFLELRLCFSDGTNLSFFCWWNKPKNLWRLDMVVFYFEVVNEWLMGK